MKSWSNFANHYWRLFFILWTISFTACEQIPNTFSTAIPEIDSHNNATRQAIDERIQIEWFVGLGDALTQKQESALQALATRFNHSQNDIWLQLIIASADEALDILLVAQQNGDLPDLIGPIGLNEANYFYGDWLDLRLYFTKTNHDLSHFSEQSLGYYERDGRLEGLPLNMYPSFIYYNRQLFDQAGLAYPPQQFDAPYADGEPWDFAKLTELAMLLTKDREGDQAGTKAFNRDDVRQFGYINQWSETTREGLVPFGADVLVDENGRVALSEAWREGVHWTYEAMWTHRIYPNQEDQFSDLFSHANTFRSGHVAMAHAPLWLTCCLGNIDFEWDISVIPSYKGETTAKLHSDGFRIFNSTPEADAAFHVLNWLLSDGYQALLLAYGGVPAQFEYTEFMVSQLDTFYPYGINWQVMLDSLAYADQPHHQAYLPNYQQAELAETLFWSLLETDPALEIDHEIELFLNHMQLIVNEDEQQQP